MLDPVYDFTAQYRRSGRNQASFRWKSAGEIERIEQRLTELARNPGGRVDRRADDRSRPARGRRDDSPRASRISRSTARRTARSPACIVTIGDDGEFRLHEGLVDLGGEDDATETGGDSDDAICEHLGNPARTLTAAMIDSRSREASGSAPTVEQTCARNAVSASCWSTISRRTGCRSPRHISLAISEWRSIWRCMRCASICSNGSATARILSICGR